jgi:hypothetical protein
MAFVTVLSYSRRIFLRFCLDARMDSFLRGHVEAFIGFGGCARILLYDNLKSAVLERIGTLCASILSCSASPLIIASSPGQWPLRAATGRGAWNAASATSAKPSSLRASSLTSTT